ncbi:DNA-binding domain-containing protein [Porifericola rhodea]|uniref:DNA-binding domain-containing protein n=1 Tax=Porifericola rhodea TaxID=930972 RepID=UPI002664EC50|nr:DNA-binding domain-containing protein [Porifericola rhodea]WKN32554.1 DNA-binding domain-containing protein [Porifericola rhodea]
MSLKYYLVDNTLTSDPNDFRAVTLSGNSNNMEDIIEMMMHRSVGISKGETTSVIEELFLAMEFLLKRGESITTPLFKISPVISGVFEDNLEAFDSQKHKIKIKVSAGTRLSKISQEVSVERVDAKVSTPIVHTFLDMDSNIKDKMLTSGQPGRVFGSKLKFDANDPQQGIFLTHVGSGTETKADFILDNMPKTITFIIPDGLPVGDYQLELRSTMGGANLRKGILRTLLNIS